jgi:uncharacterized protein YbjT (DUF2867 family)
MDDLLASTGAALRTLTIPSFMENVARQVEPIKNQGVFYDAVSPDLRLPTVATRDIASVAAKFLLDDTWTGQETIPVLGPEDLSMDDMAAIASDVVGFPVRYQRVAYEAFKDQLMGHGMSEPMAQAMVDMMVAKDHGLDLSVSRSPEAAIETPTTFRQWCEDTLKPAVRVA